MKVGRSLTSKKQKNKKKKKTHLPFRLNLLFLGVFILFSSLILRLGMVQIVNGEEYMNEVERSEDVVIELSAPRGKIYDRTGKVIVDNEALNAITYSKLPYTSQQELFDISSKLAKYITKTTDEVTLRDKKDYWLFTRSEKGNSLITDVEWDLYETEKLSDDDIYKMKLDRITEEMVSDISPFELEVIAIKRVMDKGYALTPQIIKSNVSTTEVATVSAHIGDLPGVDIATDWERKYPYNDTLRDLLGNVQKGLPSDKLDYFLARGFNRNDRVGTSYLEEQYNSILRGRKKEVQYIVDSNGNIEDITTLNEGARGDGLVLTIDMELQTQVEKILEEELLKAKKMKDNEMLDRAFAVIINPKTGEILSMAGKLYREVNGKAVLNNYATGTFTTQYEMGSAVKGATILTGYSLGAIQPGTSFYDKPVKIKGTPLTGSYTRMGKINDITALKKSSNVYMYKTVMEIANATYKYNEPINIDPKYFSIMRNKFSQFGLGIKTGIDMPFESDGLKGGTDTPGKLLFFGIGQFDTYTPLQMTQYVSTIANGGYRMKPHVVKEVREQSTGQLGPIKLSVEPQVLNKVDMKPEHIQRVQEGFRQVIQEPGGTAYSYFSQSPYIDYKAAGKTGTAETQYWGWNKKYWGDHTYNLTLIGYAPHDNPEMAFSVVVPWTSDNYSINKYIGRRIIRAYFDLKKTENGGTSEVG